MNDQPSEPPKTMKDDWNPSDADGGAGATQKPALFQPDELDIYVNKVTLEAFVFHGKEINYNQIDHLEYNPGTFMVDVVQHDGSRLDLGVKIQWVVRPYFTRAQEISIVQTRNGESINGKIVPLKHTGADE